MRQNFQSFSQTNFVWLCKQDYSVSEKKIIALMLEILLLPPQETVSRSQKSIRNTSSFQLSFVINLWLSDLSQYAISLC